SASSGQPTPTPAWSGCCGPAPSSFTACAVAERAEVVADPAVHDDGFSSSPATEPSVPAGDRRWSRAPLVAGVVGLALAALLAPAEPLPLPILLRWLAAFLLFVLLP